MPRPQAHEKTVHIYKTIKLPDVKTGGLVKTKVPTGTEVQRTAVCEKCRKPTKGFEGVNEHGWIFRCNGSAETHGSYLFVAEPAKKPVASA